MDYIISIHHHHHVALVARISLTLSHHSSLSFIALGRSSGQHHVSSHSCWMYVRAGRPAFAQPCVGVHKSTSLMSSSLLLQQCPIQVNSFYFSFRSFFHIHSAMYALYIYIYHVLIFIYGLYYIHTSSKLIHSIFLFVLFFAFILLCTPYMYVDIRYTDICIYATPPQDRKHDKFLSQVNIFWMSW